ncbi:Hypothetical predicted protein [Mytilus galloprovincialis]|uniref:Uncharacterized protein n=1 Tax=Mytilus galloprovincialis TaxID=29158 RepID=A0A8B6DYC7_MYTGA|nr:Hypothetical predicted protein [Mytilus galloprovincialis]
MTVVTIEYKKWREPGVKCVKPQTCMTVITIEYKKWREPGVKCVKPQTCMTVVTIEYKKWREPGVKCVMPQTCMTVVTIEYKWRLGTRCQTNLSLVADLSPCHDDSLWIACDPDVVLQKVKPEETNLKTISNFNIKVFGMTITPSDDLLIIGKSRLQMMSSTTDKVKDSVYDINPFLAIAVHITSGGQIIVGGGTNEGRRAVFVLNKDGDHEAVYEHNKHNQPIFSYPRRITTTSNGNIHVVDYYKDGDSGKVVVLGKADDVINIYKGDTEINKKVPFIPEGIVTTPRDNVIVVDLATNTLHILNNSGHLITYIKTTDIGIEDAYSLAFSQTGQLYIGCNEANDSTAKEAKLYKVNISGC